MSSIKNNALKATIWTLVGYGGSQVLRFGANLILTRLLVPEMFGLMSLVNTLIIGLSLFSDVGISPSIIRSKRGEESAFLNTAWTIQVLRGLLLWIICLIITIPVAKFYGESKLLWIMPIAGLTTILQGFNSTVMILLNRQLSLGKITIFEFIVQVMSLTVTISWAKIYPTIWALLGGNLVASFFGMVRSHFLVKTQKNSFAWDKEAAKEIFSFGKWIFISTAMMFLASQWDRLILGKLFSLEILGIYTIAYTFADLPKQITQRVSGQVIFPLIVQSISLERQELRKRILSQRWKMLLGLIAVVTVLFCFGDLIIMRLYDQRYIQASWMLPILALGLWPLILTTTIEKSLLAIGKPIYGSIASFLKFIYMLIGIPIGFKLGGIFGVIVIIAANDLPGYIVINYGLWKESLSCFKQDFKASLILILIIVIIITLRYWQGEGLPIDHLWIET
jgi:O-antigen/teichoic acid export membrane protein